MDIVGKVDNCREIHRASTAANKSHLPDTGSFSSANNFGQEPLAFQAMQGLQFQLDTQLTLVSKNGLEVKTVKSIDLLRGFAQHLSQFNIRFKISLIGSTLVDVLKGKKKRTPGRDLDFSVQISQLTKYTPEFVKICWQVTIQKIFGDSSSEQNFGLISFIDRLRCGDQPWGHPIMLFKFGNDQMDVTVSELTPNFIFMHQARSIDLTDFLLAKNDSLPIAFLTYLAPKDQVEVAIIQWVLSPKDISLIDWTCFVPLAKYLARGMRHETDVSAKQLWNCIFNNNCSYLLVKKIDRLELDEKFALWWDGSKQILQNEDSRSGFKYFLQTLEKSLLAQVDTQRSTSAPFLKFLMEMVKNGCWETLEEVIVLESYIGALGKKLKCQAMAEGSFSRSSISKSMFGLNLAVSFPAHVCSPPSLPLSTCRKIEFIVSQSNIDSLFRQGQLGKLSKEFFSKMDEYFPLVQKYLKPIHDGQSLSPVKNSAKKFFKKGIDKPSHLKTILHVESSHLPVEKEPIGKLLRSSTWSRIGISGSKLPAEHKMNWRGCNLVLSKIELDSQDTKSKKIRGRCVFKVNDFLIKTSFYFDPDNDKEVQVDIKNSSVELGRNMHFNGAVKLKKNRKNNIVGVDFSQGPGSINYNTFRLDGRVVGDKFEFSCGSGDDEHAIKLNHLYVGDLTVEGKVSLGGLLIFFGKLEVAGDKYPELFPVEGIVSLEGSEKSGVFLMKKTSTSFSYIHKFQNGCYEEKISLLDDKDIFKVERELNFKDSKGKRNVMKRTSENSMGFDRFREVLIEHVFQNLSCGIPSGKYKYFYGKNKVSNLDEEEIFINFEISKTNRVVANFQKKVEFLGKKILPNQSNVLVLFRVSDGFILNAYQDFSIEGRTNESKNSIMVKIPGGFEFEKPLHSSVKSACAVVHDTESLSEDLFKDGNKNVLRVLVCPSSQGDWKRAQLKKVMFEKNGEFKLGWKSAFSCLVSGTENTDFSFNKIDGQEFSIYGGGAILSKYPVGGGKRFVAYGSISSKKIKFRLALERSDLEIDMWREDLLQEENAEIFIKCKKNIYTTSNHGSVLPSLSFDSEIIEFLQYELKVFHILIEAVQSQDYWNSGLLVIEKTMDQIPKESWAVNGQFFKK